MLKDFVSRQSWKGIRIDLVCGGGGLLSVYTSVPSVEGQ